MNGHEGRWSAVRIALQLVRHPRSVGHSRTGASQLRNDCHYGTFELMLRGHGGGPTSSFLLCSLFCDALDLPEGAYVDFPRPRECEAAADRYCKLFAAYAAQPHDIFFRVPNHILRGGPHVQEHLVGQDAEEITTIEVDPWGPWRIGGG